MRGNFIPPLYQGPLGWLPRSWDHGDPDFFKDLLEADDLVYLFVGHPYDAGSIGRALATFGPFFSRPFGWSPYFRFRGRTTSVYRGDHHAYISHPTDTPANYPFPAVLDSAYSIQVGIGGQQDDRLGGGSVSFGDVQISNGTGDNDALVNYSWGGRLVEIKAGIEAWPYARFSTILRGNVSGIRASDTGINLSLSARDAVLQNPMALTYYAGTGGVEGPAELAGRVRPLVLGRCRNIPLVQIGADIWQAAESLSAVLAVRNRGIVITDSGADYPSYAALDMASVTPGYFSVCNPLGLIKFGSNVDVPTADVDGPEAWGMTTPDIIDYILRHRLGRFNLSAADIDGGSFNRAKAARGYTVGLYVDADTAVQPATDRLVRSIGGWLLPSRRGLFQIGLWARPTSSTGDITAADIDDAGPQLEARWRATRKLTLGYRPVWRLMGAGDVADSVSAEDRSFLTQAFRTVVEQRSVADRDSVEYRVDTAIDDPDDAAELASDLADFLSWATHVWRVPMRDLPLRYWPGDRRRMVYDRHGLGAGAYFLTTGIVEGDGGSNELVLLGGRP